MSVLDIAADKLVSALLSLAAREHVSILDSCGVSHLGSHLLIAGIDPIEMFEISNDDPNKTLQILDQKLTGGTAAIFTLSYDLGRKMLGIGSFENRSQSPEPDAFVACFDVLIIHDYETGITNLVGDRARFGSIKRKIRSEISDLKFEIADLPVAVTSNFVKGEYLAAIDAIKERIRDGQTYQTNLTQQLGSQLPEDLTPETIFARLRRDHPAPFSAFIKRSYSTVISASPERFFSVRKRGNTTDCGFADSLSITTSPIKGTRPRGNDDLTDDLLRHELLTSPKDLAENTMIVDLLRNDLGRVCEYGSVKVEKLCDLEEHPTLFHLVSTINGDLRSGTTPSDILRALFPCGSITGAPKISTMRIIDEVESASRGLSMGAIGYYLPAIFDGSDSDLQFPVPCLDLSVAIRTMVVCGRTSTFNVGGGIVIDSDPESEYAETLTKAKALLDALGGRLDAQR
ncbi:MAG: anthranilate synthase component I family protein [Pyrinomonadaceae bacterium]|nr:anthranilate synthase component I family protein [Acidobacteriota bacterium]MBK7934244.1 anthranilate synthase component I family protein [Acidobacteriota bacterium]MBP7375271.1 anthranilate synthase component I family protein [Pyrinomonadaceae bacterium]